MKSIVKFIIPLALFILWGYLTVLYIFDYNLSLSGISYPHDKNNFVSFNTNRLYVGQKITGEFVADENYLGIVTVSFATFGSKVAYLSEDNLVFRIKQSGAKDWYYEQTYKSGLMYDVPLYPFGFPKINDSKGKRYVFEIESLNGNEKNAVALNSWEPISVMRYQLPKEDLLQDRAKLIEFFKRKLLVAFGSRDVQFFSLVYALPFFFYFLLFIYPFNKMVISLFNLCWNKFAHQLERLAIVRWLKQTREFKRIARYSVSIKNFFKTHLDLVLVLVILVDIFLIPVVNNIAFIVVIVLWTALAKRYKYTSKESFIVGFIFLVLCPLILLFKLDNIAEKSGAWAYMFFVAGTIQILMELKSEK